MQGRCDSLPRSYQNECERVNAFNCTVPPYVNKTHRALNVFRWQFVKISQTLFFPSCEQDTSCIECTLMAIRENFSNIILPIFISYVIDCKLSAAFVCENSFI